MKTPKIIYLTLLSLLLAFAGCDDDDYVASVTELRLVRVAPTSGYAGDIVRILGRNFSVNYGENTVTINGKQAKVLDIAKDELSVVMPANEPGSYPIRVETPAGEIEGLAFKYNVQPEKEYYVTTVAGSGKFGCDDGVGGAATLQNPEGLNYDKDGNIWIVQRGTFAIRRMNAAYSITTICTSSLLNYPWQGAFDSKWDYYVANKSGNDILKVTADGACTRSEISGAKFNNPMCLIFDPADNMYIANRNGNEVLKVVGGAVVGRYAVPMPESLAFDAQGRIIVGTNNAYNLYMIAPDGTVSVIAGYGVKPTGLNYSDGEAGDLASATIGMVGGIFCATDGCIYFTDRTAFTVRKLTPAADGDYAAGKIETIAGVPGSAAVADGYGNAAKFLYSAGIVVSNDCTEIHVADGSGHRIRRLKLR